MYGAAINPSGSVARTVPYITCAVIVHTDVSTRIIRIVTLLTVPTITAAESIFNLV